MSNNLIEGELCSNDAHQAKIFFCKSCARHKQGIAKIFFCQICHPDPKAHQNHGTDKLAVAGKDFQAIYKKFKGDIKKWAIIEYDKKSKEKKLQLSFSENKAQFNSKVEHSNACFQKLLLETDFQKKIRAELQDLKYLAWLVNHKFWENNPTYQEIKQELGSFIQSLFEGEKLIEQNPWEMKLVLNKKHSSEGGSVNYQEEMSKLHDKVDDLAKQKQIGQLFIRLCSYFTNEEIEKGLAEIETFEQSYTNIPFVFYLAKLKVCELHSEGSQKIKKILEDPHFPLKTDKEKQLFNYFTALTEWELVEQTEQETEDSVLFYEGRNKQYYKLANPQRYIQSLTQAIDIEPRPLYFASRAIGYMLQERYELAEKDFNQADKQKFKGDALLSNRLYNNSKRNIEMDRAIIKQSLCERSTEYISNMCKYLKSRKEGKENKSKQTRHADFKYLKLCCEELVSREPNNLAFRLKNFEAAYKLKDKDSAKEELSYIKQLNEIEEEELEELERKLELLKAEEHESLGLYEQASTKYEHVAEMGSMEVPTYWYNYAAYLFNHREEQENNEKALKAINRALELSTKPQYYKLKYLLLFVSDNMEEAKKMHPQLAASSNELKPMMEYVNDHV